MIIVLQYDTGVTTAITVHLRDIWHRYYKTELLHLLGLIYEYSDSPHSLVNNSLLRVVYSS
jgi:hypothetical protein